jgi:hypothetical protein
MWVGLESNLRKIPSKTAQFCKSLNESTDTHFQIKLNKKSVFSKQSKGQL